MIKLKNTRVVSFSRDHQDVYWEIEPTNEDIQEYEFFVERSEAEAGPFDVIAGPLIDRYYFRDSDVHLISTTRVYFYRIRARHLPSGREEVTGEFDRWGEEDLLALEMIRRARLLFEEHAGTKMWVFPRRTFGMRCPQCWNPVLGKRVQDSCPTCFNTGFSGGYHHPTRFWGQINDPEDAEQVTLEDHRQVKYFNLRTIASPYIKPLDLLVDHNNRRYRIVSGGGTTKHGVGVSAILRLVEIQKGSIEDTVPLRIDAAEEAFFPARNFTNPQNLESAERTSSSQDVDLDKILGAYRYR